MSLFWALLTLAWAAALGEQSVSPSAPWQSSPPGYLTFHPICCIITVGGVVCHIAGAADWVWPDSLPTPFFIFFFHPPSLLIRVCSPGYGSRCPRVSHLIPLDHFQFRHSGVRQLPSTSSSCHLALKSCKLAQPLYWDSLEGEVERRDNP